MEKTKWADSLLLLAKAYNQSMFEEVGQQQLIKQQIIELLDRLPQSIAELSNRQKIEEWGQLTFEEDWGNYELIAIADNDSRFKLYELATNKIYYITIEENRIFFD